MLLTNFSLRNVERWLIFLQKISNSRTSLCWVGNHSGWDLSSLLAFIKSFQKYSANRGNKNRPMWRLRRLISHGMRGRQLRHRQKLRRALSLRLSVTWWRVYVYGGHRDYQIGAGFDPRSSQRFCHLEANELTIRTQCLFFTKQTRKPMKSFWARTKCIQLTNW